MLKAFYEHVKGKGLPFEIIFVSSDKSEAEAASYFQNDHGDWLILDLGQKDALSQKYGIKGIPSLIVIDSAGKPVAPDARDHVGGSGGKPEAMEKAFADWQKLCSDWRGTAGASVGGAPQAQDAAAMRAARLARLGGGPPVSTPAPAPAPEPAAAPAAAPAPAAEPNAAEIDNLVALGFTREQVKNALDATKGDVDAAANLLLS